MKTTPATGTKNTATAATAVADIDGLLPNEKEIDFETLCQEFQRYYKEFNEGFNSLKMKPDDFCYVLFGISGAGKSTTLARLLSNMTAEEFYDTIQDRTGERKKFCMIEKIAIGHTVLSTTVVPKVYRVGPFYVCDMPGFAETSPQKKISIDVLQKSFLTRMDKAKFLVVVDMNTLLDTRCETILEHYHKPLARLLGDQYAASIDHFYFVLTNNQELQYSDRDVENMVQKMAFEILSENHLGACFLRRLSERKVIVDLESDDNNSLLEKIKEMVERDQTQKVSLNRANSWKIDHLQAGENLLNRFCLKHLAVLAEEQKDLERQLDLLQDDFTALKTAHTAETTKARRGVDNAIEDYRKLAIELFSTTEAVDSFGAAKAKLVETIKYTEEMLVVHTRQRSLFENHFVDADFINYRCDVSQMIAKRRAPASHTISLSADVTSDGSNERLVLVMEHEEDDDTLKNYINRSGSLIPGSLQDIKKIDLASVLYNSHMHINRCQAEHVSTDPSGGIVTLVINRSKPFKVYIYSERPFKEVHYFEEFKIIFGRDVQNDGEKIAMLQAQLELLEKKYEEDKRKKRNLKETVAAASQTVVTAKTKAKETQQLHDETCKRMKQEIRNLESLTAGHKNNSVASAISDIEHIFRSNKINTALSSPLEQFKAAFLPIENNVTELLDSIERFSTSDRDELTRALVKDPTFSRRSSSAMPGTLSGTEETSVSSLGSC